MTDHDNHLTLNFPGLPPVPAAGPVIEAIEALPTPRYDADSYDYVEPAVRTVIPQAIMHELWACDPDGGETEPTPQDYARFRAWVLHAYGQPVHDAYFNQPG